MTMENQIANIDMVKYRRDSGVLVARTYECMGVGVVEITPKRILVAWVDEKFENYTLPVTSSMISKFINVELSENIGDAILHGISVVQRWFDQHSPDFSPRRLTIDDFTEVIKDAQPNEPHMQKLGGGVLSRMELIASEHKLGKIQRQGILVPLKSIVGKYK